MRLHIHRPGLPIVIFDAFKEEQHPRKKGGQFAKKGEGEAGGGEIPAPPQIKSPHAANIGKQKHLNALHQHAKAGEWSKVEAYPTPGTNTYAKMVQKYKADLLKQKPGGPAPAAEPKIHVHVEPALSPGPAKTAPVAPKHNIKGPVELAGMEQTGPKLGSNPGGTYKDKDGKEYYVKIPKSDDHAKNEMLAAALFGAAGGNSLIYHPVTTPDGKLAVGTEKEKLDKNNVSQLSPAQKQQAQRDFALHAWLANWDAAGLSGDNIGTVGNTVLPLDFGGSLLYRAQGAPKGEAFGNAATEFESLRNPSKNPSAAKLYGDMTKEQLLESAQRLGSITNEDIKNLVDKFGPGQYQVDKDELAQKLAFRRNSVMQQAAAEAKAPAAQPAAPSPAQRSSTEAHTLRKDIAGWNPPKKPQGAVSNYKGSGYRPINARLRFFSKADLAADPSEEAAHIRQMTDWFDQASSKEDMVLFRGIPKDIANQIKLVAKVGLEIEDPGFLSMATYKPFSDNWHHGAGLTYTVAVPKGSKVATVKQAHEEDGEYEVMTQRHSKLRITKWEPHNDLYEVTLVSPEAQS
jgi:hypothetical protein